MIPVGEASKYFEKMFYVCLLNQSFNRLKTNAEIFDNHSQKQIHQHESDHHNEQEEVYGSNSKATAVAINRYFTTIRVESVESAVSA